MTASDRGEPILRERLAAIQHEIWAHWMKHLFSVSIRNADGSYTIPLDKARRWHEQVQRHYTELSECEKDSDREQADKILVALNQDC
jgi:hypothetical protein